jgi:hypothetical protein
MTDDRSDARLFGQALTDLPPAALADALRRAGLDARYRESAHRVGGAYVRVDGPGGADCSLERGEPGEYLVHDAGGEREPLEALARALSAALAKLGVRHRLELYDDGDPSGASPLHRWPASS